MKHQIQKSCNYYICHHVCKQIEMNSNQLKKHFQKISASLHFKNWKYFSIFDKSSHTLVLPHTATYSHKSQLAIAHLHTLITCKSSYKYICRISARQYTFAIFEIFNILHINHLKVANTTILLHIYIFLIHLFENQNRYMHIIYVTFLSSKICNIYVCTYYICPKIQMLINLKYKV